MPHRGGIAKEDTGGKHKAESTKKRGESRDRMFFILTPES
jgi:hypothetical protein